VSTKAHRPGGSLPNPIPARAGVGLKPEHYGDILEGRPDIGWFEVHPENYMGEGGPPHHVLEQVRAHYPLSLHGVGLSIGAAHPLNRQHLARLKALADRYEPGLFSEHLAWSTHEDTFLSDLLPLPYTHETLTHVARHVDEVQSFLARPILIENPSTYVRFGDEEMDEIAFLSELARRTGCGLVLDVNNVYVSAVNHGFDAAAYVDAFPMDHVGEIHLAGHAEAVDDDGAPFLIDAHDRAVRREVWTLYESAIARAGARPTLIEWDNDIPSWPVLLAESRRAERIMQDRRSNHAPEQGGPDARP
jgi:uncharacterized protein (UPF0276 family)